MKHDILYTQISWRKLKFGTIVQQIRGKRVRGRHSLLLSGRRFFRGTKEILFTKASLVCMSRTFFFARDLSIAPDLPTNKWEKVSYSQNTFTLRQR
jgi:hypothetical protein